jgi:hypothetical protein
MATYKNPNGDQIITNGSTYTFYENYFNHHMEKRASVDVSKWSNNAEKWIDNDIQNGYYSDYKKVDA